MLNIEDLKKAFLKCATVDERVCLGADSHRYLHTTVALFESAPLNEANAKDWGSFSKNQPRSSVRT